MVNGEIAAGGVARYRPRGVKGNGNQLSTEFFAGKNHHVFVLLAVESAGAVDEKAPRTERRPHVAENFALPFGTMRHGFGRPLGSRLEIFAKHALARAGNVGGDEIETLGQATEIRRIGVGHDGVGVSPLNEVFGENVGARFHRFVGHEECVVGQERAPERAFAAGGGAEIEGTLGRAVGKRGTIGRRHEHRRGFLHIISAGMPTRIEGEGGSRRKVAPFFAPRHGGGGKGDVVGHKRQLIGRPLGGVAAHTHGSVAFGEGNAKRARLGGTEESAQSGDKSFGKHHARRGFSGEFPSR